MLRSLLRNPIQFLFTTAKQQQGSITHLRFLSKTLIHDPDQSSSFTVSYLINSCGLSPQSALSAAQKINLKTTVNADSILALLKSYGFTNTHIAAIATKYPQLLSFNLDTNVKPKLDYLLSAGCSVADLTALISSTPQLLHRSLENRLKTNFSLIKPILGTDQLVAAAVRRCPRLLENNLENNFLPNVKTLQSYGVPDPHIAKLAAREARVLMQKPEQFKMTVDAVRKMWLDPSSAMFVRGVGAMAGMEPLKWESKVAFSSEELGWSEQELMSAFLREPSIMQVSEKKLRRAMDFFVKKMGWGPSFLSKKPELLKYSFEQRIIPRCSVFSVLVSKGLVMENPSTSFLTINEEKFLNYYVYKYQDQVPEVLEAYRGNLETLGLKQELPIVEGCNNNNNNN